MLSSPSIKSLPPLVIQLICENKDCKSSRNPSSSLCQQCLIAKYGENKNLYDTSGWKHDQNAEWFDKINYYHILLSIMITMVTHYISKKHMVFSFI